MNKHCLWGAVEEKNGQNVDGFRSAFHEKSTSPGVRGGPWDHPVAPFAPDFKKHEKNTFGDHFSSVFFSIFSIFSHDFFLHVF